MRIVRSDQRRLLIIDFPWLIGLIAFPCAVVMLGHAIALLAHREHHTGDLVGATLGAVMFFLGGAVFTKRSEFDFDLIGRKLTWRRRGLFTNIGGVVPLDQIRHAAVESLPDRDGGPTYRVCLRTTSGPIPLTDAYDSNGAKAESIRAVINEVLNVPVTRSEQIENDILELAIAGRKIDAIALARQRYGYTLAQARDFVDGLSG